jgi:predicted membrane GTPase involved in stress response
LYDNNAFRERRKHPKKCPLSIFSCSPLHPLPAAPLPAEDDALQTTFEAFAATHCGKFDFEAEEHKLEYQDVYKAYQATFEGLIEGHLQGRGADVEGFFAICTKVVEVGDGAREALLPMLTAITDYDVFIGLMQETKAKMAEAEAEAGAGA